MGVVWAEFVTTLKKLDQKVVGIGATLLREHSMYMYLMFQLSIRILADSSNIFIVYYHAVDCAGGRS